MEGVDEIKANKRMRGRWWNKIRGRCNILKISKVQSRDKKIELEKSDHRTGWDRMG